MMHHASNYRPVLNILFYMLTANRCYDNEMMPSAAAHKIACKRIKWMIVRICHRSYRRFSMQSAWFWIYPCNRMRKHHKNCHRISFRSWFMIFRRFLHKPNAPIFQIYSISSGFERSFASNDLKFYEFYEKILNVSFESSCWNTSFIGNFVLFQCNLFQSKLSRILCCSMKIMKYKSFSTVPIHITNSISVIRVHNDKIEISPERFNHHLIKFNFAIDNIRLKHMFPIFVSTYNISVPFIAHFVTFYTHDMPNWCFSLREDYLFDKNNLIFENVMCCCWEQQKCR